jgi:hypothetical protein
MPVSAQIIGVGEAQIESGTLMVALRRLGLPA